MKKFFTCLFLITFLMALPQFVATASAKKSKSKWKSVPLVKDGLIDETVWEIDDSSANITPDGDRVKFEHLTNSPNDSAWLKLIKCPETVRGLMVTVEMGADLVSELRARIGLEHGVYGPDNDVLWGALQVRKRTPDKDEDWIHGNLNANDFFDNWNWLYDLTWVQFANPIDVAGKTFTLKMEYNNQMIKFTVEGYGTSTYQLPEGAKSPYELFWGIGTRSNDDSGSGTVHFSDVKVLTGGKCDKKVPKIAKTFPANKQKNVSVNLDQVWVTFKEAMQSQYSWEPPFTCTNENQTEFQYPNQFVCKNNGETLEYNTLYTVCLNEDGFFDLAGNGNREYCFRFQTEKNPAAAE